MRKNSLGCKMETWLILTWRDIKISNSRQKINSLGFMMKMSRGVIFRSMTRSWLLEGKEKISYNLWEKMPRDVRWNCDWAVLWLHVTHSWLLEGKYKILNNVWEKNALAMITWRDIKISNSRQKINPLGFMMKMSWEVIFRSMTRSWLLEGKENVIFDKSYYDHNVWLSQEIPFNNIALY